MKPQRRFDITRVRKAPPVTSEQVAADIAAFRKGGGCIERVPLDPLPPGPRRSLPAWKQISLMQGGAE